MHGRNKDHAEIGQPFCRLLIAVPLKMYGKFGQPKWRNWSENGQLFLTLELYVCIHKTS